VGALRIAKESVPLARFKAQAARILRDARARHRAVILTQKGENIGIIVPPEEFERLQERERLVQAVAEGLADVRAGRVVTDKELARDLDREFGPLR